MIPTNYTYAKSLKDIREERDGIKQELSKNEQDIVEILTEMKQLDSEINILEESFRQNESAIEEVESDITEVQIEIDELEEKIEERFNILSERAKAYQQNGGNISYLEVILGSESFTDFISRINAVSKITESDADIIRVQQKEQKKVEEKLAELEGLQAELEEMKELIKDQKDEANNKREQLKEKEIELNNITKKLKKKDRNLAKLEESLFEESSPKIIHSSSSNGIFAWPTTGGYISSPFGSRWGSTHKGLDIARTDRSTKPPILAGDDGVVESAGNKNNGYGNMIIINHGNGLKTLYAHLSSINVKSGQKVKRGEQIGVMGTTGNSTGIHLHFEVHENGTPKNPIPYLR